MSQPFRANSFFSNRLQQAQQQRAAELPKAAASQASGAAMSATTKPSQRSGMAAQFQSWVSDKEALERSAKGADRARETLDQQLKQIRQQQLEVNEKFHGASNELGAVHRQRDMLVAEKAKLEGTLAQERSELKACAKAIEQACQEETEGKRAYRKEMGELNLELGDLLRKGEEARLKALLSVDTVDRILAHHRKSLDGSGSPDSQDEEDLIREMEEAAAVLRDKSLQHRAVLAEHDKLLAVLKDAKERVLEIGRTGSTSPTQRFSAEGLKELESKWLQEEMESADGIDKSAMGDGSGPPADPIHLKIFYGDDAPGPSGGEEREDAEPPLESADAVPGDSKSHSDGGTI